MAITQEAIVYSSFSSNIMYKKDVINMNKIKTILHELETVPPAYRAIFNLYIIDGYTHKEIADRLGIAVGTSKSNLHKAKLSLRKKLKKYNIYEN
jgi:RNA polymerase sigma-70 factor (ECF subfamily)